MVTGPLTLDNVANSELHSSAVVAGRTVWNEFWAGKLSRCLETRHDFDVLSALRLISEILLNPPTFILKNHTQLPLAGYEGRNILQDIKIRQQGLHHMSNSLFTSDTHPVNPKSADQDCFRAKGKGL